jgi:hypothetical protein
LFLKPLLQFDRERVDVQGMRDCMPRQPRERKVESKPDIIVTQGAEAREVIVRKCKVVRHERKEVDGATYETGVAQLTAEKEALWIST